MFYLTRKVGFEASHRYALPGMTEEENLRLFGESASPYGHGHNYLCWATIRGRVQARTGVVMDIRSLDSLLRRAVGEFDHTFINIEHPAFGDRNPTLENLLLYLWESIAPGLPQGSELWRVRLDEDPLLYAEYMGTGRMVYVTKTFSFSAAHRLHNPLLSARENMELYGKCNNPHGHGHNYELEVTVKGEVDGRTGQTIDPDQMDAAVQDLIIGRFDHRNLNLEVVELSELNPTSENVAKVAWDLLNPRLPGLYRLALWETPKSRFEYYGEAGEER